MEQTSVSCFRSNICIVRYLAARLCLSEQRPVALQVNRDAAVIPKGKAGQLLAGEKMEQLFSKRIRTS